MKSKRRSVRNGSILTSIVCVVMALVLLIGYKGLNWGKSTPPPTSTNAPTNLAANNESEPRFTQEVLEFPNSDLNNGPVLIPLHTTLAQLNIDSGDETVNTVVPPIPEMTFALSQEMKNQVEATLVYRPDIGGGYVILAPAGWLATAVVGANGSYGVTFQDPNNPEQNMNYSDTAWSCTGCAITSIGAYFPDKAEWADAMGFTIYNPLKFSERHILGAAGAEARTVRYTLSADSNGYQDEGAAYYDEGEWGYLFRSIKIHLSQITQHQEVVETLMKFFTDNHGPLFIADPNREKSD
ncbi:hypothetical protein M2444_001969 [Paenibacillus sp. PastF-3]|uniref:DUF4850 domain-containing protein n=1 Tax=Paenibacillus sp. PastF-3 TaxID=2940626 RepID=UPI0024761C0E|nr:DUF4850 domain-containing protein [Paenibacillus sp. PastF-3]MDH6370189.1 hypothetical protein [Paenibacillus sp. PastF-3]